MDLPNKAGLLSDIRRSARYHEHRLSFFSFWHQVTSFLTILLSGSVLLQISDSNFKMAWWLTAMSVLAALLAALDMVVGYAKMADTHKQLKRKFCILEDKILKANNSKALSQCESERLEIEMDEPPIYSALDLVCRNEQAAAEGINGKDAYVHIVWYKYLTRHHIRWPNIAQDINKENWLRKIAKYKTLIVGMLVLITLIVLASFGSKLLDGYNNYSAKETANKGMVFNSAYDGSVRQVEEWLQKNFNDPKSIEKIEWSPVVKTGQGTYMVRYKFRANNESSSKQTYNKVFILGSTGIVITVSDAPS